jgi:7,8-didemethyl-8-hydroxy-5-deazariboflavin synthase CofH subunit
MTTLNLFPLEDVLNGVTAPVRTVLEKALQDQELNFDEALRLFEVQGSDFLALLCTADELRKRQVGDRITYVKVRNINFTNICYSGCAFCAFSRPAGDPEAYTFTIEEVVEQAKEAWALGCSEVCLQGGLNPKLGGTIYLELLRAIKTVLPQVHIHAFSPFEIDYASRLLNKPPAFILQELKEAGLGSLPGTAAEILDDELRGQLCPNKLTTSRWIEIIQTAHRLGIPSTATMMYGHLDQPYHWVKHMLLLRDIQRQSGGFTEFVPLGFVHKNTRLYAQGKARPGPSGMESLKVHAIARLLLGREIGNIQVSWVKLGPPLAQMCLQAGANDFGGTLLNERISRMAGATSGEYMPPGEFERLIRELGRIPAERDTLYRILREDGKPVGSGAAALSSAAEALH